MNTSSSFLDLLFILLLATLAMLSDSSRLGAIDGAPAKAGAQGVSPIDADAVVVLYVTDDALIYQQQLHTSLADLPKAAKPGPNGCVLLIPADQTVAHHRVIEVWSQAQDLGWPCKLGVRRESP